MSKILAICGSPRKEGNIETMLETAVALARAQGHIVTCYNPYEMEIAYCKGCMACKKSSKCVIADDLSLIREDLLTCDICIVAAPTYFANIPACLKNVLDRLVATVMDDNESLIPKPKLSKSQKYILMTTCSTPAPFDRFSKQSTGAMKAMNEVFHISGMKCIGKIIYAGTRNKNAIPEKIINKITKSIERINA